MITILLLYKTIAGICLYSILKPADENTNISSAEQPNIAFGNLYVPAGLLKLPLEEIKPNG
jgi:hypothetical protein